MRYEKSAERKAVEAVMSAIPMEAPLTSVQVAEMVGLDVHVLRNHIVHALDDGCAHVVNPGRRPSLYAGGPAPVRETTVRMQEGVYRGEPAIPLRPGCMDAFEAPSLFNGEQVARVRPAIIGASVQTRGM